MSQTNKKYATKRTTVDPLEVSTNKHLEDSLAVASITDSTATIENIDIDNISIMSGELGEINLEDIMQQPEVDKELQTDDIPVMDNFSIGEISYASLISGDSKLLTTSPITMKSETYTEPDLAICTNESCNVLDITTTMRQKNKLPSNKSLIITNPILTPLWQEPSTIGSSKTMYTVRGGTELSEEEVKAKLAEIKKPGEENMEPHIIYKIVPNTHAHVIKYVVPEDEEPLGENEIVEIVDNEQVIHIQGDSASLLNNETDGNKNDNKMDVAEEEYQNTIPLAKVPLARLLDTEKQKNTTTQLTHSAQVEQKKTKSLEQRLDILEMRCQWSDQQMFKMHNEIKQLKSQITALTERRRSKRSRNGHDNGTTDGNENDELINHNDDE